MSKVESSVWIEPIKEEYLLKRTECSVELYIGDLGCAELNVFINVKNKREDLFMMEIKSADKMAAIGEALIALAKASKLANAVNNGSL